MTERLYKRVFSCILFLTLFVCLSFYSFSADYINDDSVFPGTVGNFPSSTYSVQIVYRSNSSLAPVHTDIVNIDRDTSEPYGSYTVNYSGAYDSINVNVSASTSRNDFSFISGSIEIFTIGSDSLTSGNRSIYGSSGSDTPDYVFYNYIDNSFNFSSSAWRPNVIDGSSFPVNVNLTNIKIDGAVPQVGDTLHFVVSLRSGNSASYTYTGNNQSIIDASSSYQGSVSSSLGEIYDQGETIIAEQSAGFAGLSSQLSNVESSLGSSLEWMAYNLSALSNGLSVGSTWESEDGEEYDYPQYNQLSFSLVNEHVQIDSVPKCGTFLGILSRKFDELFEFFRFQFEIFFQWFYPLKNSTPQYWLVYNSDTNQGEYVNPATVTYYITWYLGKLYLQQSQQSALGQLEENVNDLADDLAAFEQSEQAVISSISSGIQSFAPDLSQLGSFRALAWCSNYLQQVYVSLGLYGTVILIGLLLGVCMQFIGYFRYK